MDPLTTLLLQSNEPSIQYKTRIHLLDEPTDSPHLCQLRLKVKYSPRAVRLLSERDPDGIIPCHPYKKWYGAHWVLSALADLGYPLGDQSLIPMRNQVLDWLLSPEHARSIFTVEGRVRRCASQEGNALYSILALGIADERASELARRLMLWQWPDGGWNCDKRPSAHHSSFMETAIPMRALALYSRHTGDLAARRAAEKAAQVFLKRQLFRRTSTGEIIDPSFLSLHYPIYWHYDILWGLKLMAESGFIGDTRCTPALDQLQAKQLAGGGFPAEVKLYRPANPAAAMPISERVSGYSLVNWAPTGKSSFNEFVTVDALWVLKQAGRWSA